MDMREVEALLVQLEKVDDVHGQYLSRHTEIIVQLIAEVSALSRAVGILGSFLGEISNVIPTAALADILDSVEEAMDPEQREKARIVLSNLRVFWKA